MKKGRAGETMASWTPLASATPLTRRALPSPELVRALCDRLVHTTDPERRRRFAEQLHALVMRLLERQPARAAALKRGAEAKVLRDRIRRIADLIEAEGKTKPRNLNSKVRSRYKRLHPGEKPISAPTVHRALQKK